MKENGLYNNNQKMRFLREAAEKITDEKSQKDYCVNGVNFFRKSASTEAKLRKDLADFTVANIMDYYKNELSGLLATYLRNIHLFYNIYAKWVHPDESAFKDVSYNMMMMCLKKDDNFVTKEDLFFAIPEFKNDYEKVIVLGVFEGLSLEDMAVMTIDDLNRETRMIKRNGRKDLCVSNELRGYMIGAANAKCLIPYSTDIMHTSDRYTKLDVSDNRIIRRRIYNDGNDILRLKRALGRLRDIFGYEWLRVNVLRTSGIVNYLLANAEKGESIRDVSERCANEVRERYLEGWRYSRYFGEKYGYLFD